MDFIKKNYSWTLDGLRECMRENAVESEIIAYNDNAAIVHVKNYRDSQILGAASDWCITQHRESWVQYVVKGGRIQLFFYYFNTKKCQEFEQLVGATFECDSHGVARLYCCFGKNNHPIKDYYSNAHHRISDLEALNQFILNRFFNLSFFNNAETELGNCIARIGKEMKEKELENQKKMQTAAIEEFMKKCSKIKEAPVFKNTISTYSPYSYMDDDVWF